MIVSFVFRLVLCPAISTPDSGSVIVSADGSVTIATFSCEFGYYISGDATLRCLENGNWDAEEPICGNEHSRLKTRKLFYISFDRIIIV